MSVMSVAFNLKTAPYVDPLIFFFNEYGLMVVGAFLLLVALYGRRFHPLSLLPLVIGLGLVVAGAAHLLLPLGR